MASSLIGGLRYHHRRESPRVPAGWAIVVDCLRRWQPWGCAVPV